MGILKQLSKLAVVLSANREMEGFLANGKR
jgi:hypothetical protein